MKNNAEKDMNIAFIINSQSRESAADIIAESLMSEHGANERGFWAVSGKNLLSLILFYVATSRDIKDSDRTLRKCMDILEKADDFPGVIMKESVRSESKDFLQKRLRSWVDNKDSRRIASEVLSVLQKEYLS